MALLILVILEKIRFIKKCKRIKFKRV